MEKIITCDRWWGVKHTWGKWEKVSEHVIYNINNDGTKIVLSNLKK